MNDTVDRLLLLQKQGKFASKSAAAKAYGIPYESYKKLVSGERGLTRELCEQIADYFGISRGWLMFGDGTPDGEGSIEVSGFIAAGQQITLFEDGGHSRISAFVAAGGTAAFEVRGDSMFPVARERDIVIFGPERRDVTRYIGTECAVVLEDGRRFFKVLERGSRPGRYDLHSYNAEPMRDVEVHSAGPFLALKRR